MYHKILRAILAPLMMFGLFLVTTSSHPHKDFTPSASSEKSHVETSKITKKNAKLVASHPGVTLLGRNGKTHTITGQLLEQYNSLDAELKQELGEPREDLQRNPDGGVFQSFEGGTLVHSDHSYVVWGKIRNKWNELEGTQGKLGYPISNMTLVDGQQQQSFEHGIITWKPGDDQARVIEK